VPTENAEASVAEIERRADDPAYAQVFMLTRTSEPLGNRRYWPIYAAAERHGFPSACTCSAPAATLTPGTGWPSYYVEEGAGHSTSCQTAVSSLVIEGVFERFPRLKVVMIEGGFAWLPALAWRLDKLAERMRSEVPHLKKKPSEYIRQHIWVTTQPMEEPENRQHLFDTMEWIGWDRCCLPPTTRTGTSTIPSAPSRPACHRSATSRSSPATGGRYIGWGKLSSRALCPGSIVPRTPELVDSWIPGTSPGMTGHATPRRRQGR
jgi:hypothetical protein